MVQIALLSAIVVVLQLFFSAVKIGVVTLNFVLVPIVIAGVLLGAKAGFIVGAFAGITTFIQVFTSGDPFYMFLMANNPVATACICILKTGLAGLCVGLLAKAFKKFQNGNLRLSRSSNLSYREHRFVLSRHDAFLRKRYAVRSTLCRLCWKWRSIFYYLRFGRP